MNESWQWHQWCVSVPLFISLNSFVLFRIVIFSKQFLPAAGTSPLIAMSLLKSFTFWVHPFFVLADTFSCSIDNCYLIFLLEHLSYCSSIGTYVNSCCHGKACVLFDCFLPSEHTHAEGCVWSQRSDCLLLQLSLCLSWCVHASVHTVGVTDTWGPEGEERIPRSLSIGVGGGCNRVGDHFWGKVVKRSQDWAFGVFQLGMTAEITSGKWDMKA